MSDREGPRSARRKSQLWLRSVSSSLRRHESSIAALSVFISSVGLLIAAMSAWTAWQQVQIISRDRQTPFRAVLFDQQVSAMNSALENMARFQSATICAQSVVINGNRGGDAEARRACVNEMSEAYVELELSIKRSIALWPEESNSALRTFLVEAAEQNACMSHALIFRQSSFRIDDQEVTCSEFESGREKLLALEMAARRAMDQDIRKTSDLED